MIIEQLIKNAQSRIDGAKATMAKFTADVLEHPEAAMMRSSTMFTETAAIIVWGEVLHNAQSGAAPEDILKTLEDHIFYTAANPPHSSSQLGNYLEVEKNRMRAEVANQLKRLVRCAPQQSDTTA